MAGHVQGQVWSWGLGPRCLASGPVAEKLLDKRHGHCLTLQPQGLVLALGSAWASPCDSGHRVPVMVVWGSQQQPLYLSLPHQPCHLVY